MSSFRMIHWKQPFMLLIALAVPRVSGALHPVKKDSGLAAKEFFKPELFVSSSTLSLAEISPRLKNLEAVDAFRTAYGSNFHFFYDPRSGTLVNGIGAIPLLPGDGVGNQVTLAGLGKSLGRPIGAVDGAVVAEVMRSFFLRHQELLAIDAAQLGEIRAERIHEQLWQINAPQTVKGIPVRYGRLLATLSHGNLILFGAERWGNVSIEMNPAVTPEQAMKTGFSYLDGMKAGDKLWRSPELEIVPFAPPEYQQGEAFAGPVGRGYGHRLAWVFGMTRPGEGGRWEFRVDARTGELLSFEDTNQYITKQIKGGIYPITSTGICPAPDICGVMQTDYPMPFADTGLPAPNNFTNSAGNFDWTSGTVTTTLNGRYVRSVDVCGATSESTASPDLNLGGVNNQHDCTSGGASPGNTPASRSAFYELNKIAELARGWLPGNTWLNAQLTANLNQNSTCNANWNGTSVQFFRSGGGCRNTGEIAAVFDHEWGHGMDDNDANPVISNPGEGYADIVGIYKLQSSCVGYGFFETQDFTCGRTPDNTGPNYNERQTAGPSHCDTMCSGVRDADWRRHADNLPDTPLGYVCTMCNTSSAVCGRQVHCAAAPVRQAAWDFAKFDLQAAPFNYDQNRAFIVANKAFYQGSGNIGDWYSCTCGGASAGCAAANGYMQWLAADDDDGNINNGTPHMTALFAAYDRHGIACATPTPTNSGCVGAPINAPTLTATPGSNSNNLSWTAVGGATEYWVFRGEGNGGCDSGKARIATVLAPTLTYTDNDGVNGRTYYYSVVPATANSACFGPSSACVAVTPQPCSGTIGLQRATFNCADTMNITLVDGDLIGGGTHSVAVTSTTETTPENLILTENPANSGVFTGSFMTGAPPPVNGDGRVSVVNGNTINIRYVDVSYCGTPNVPVDKTAAVDCAAPLISNVATTAITDSGATITWDTNENANSRVTYGTSPPPASNSDDLATYVTSHSRPVTGLAGCTSHVYSVTSVDGAANSATANNGDSYYNFTTYGRGFLVGPDNADTDGIWTPTGTAGSIWHRDTCKANSPVNAWKAGAPAGTCPGQYGNTVDTYLTSTAINLGAPGHGFHLRFFEWYDTEAGFDYLRPQISTNGGAAWTTLGTQYAGVGTAWAQKDYDLAAYSGSVLIRFWFHTDGSVIGEGWYVDDIEVSRPQPCGAEVRTQSSSRSDVCAAGGAGNGNSYLDPAENSILQVTAINNGSLPATVITARLTTTTPGITIADDTASFPDMASSATGASLAPHFAFVIAPTVPCGTMIAFQIEYTSAQGSWTDNLSYLVGQPSISTTTYNSTNVPVAIPDNTTVTSTLTVPASGNITDVNVGLNITHTYDGDLDIFLIHPDGTRVELTTDNGGTGENFVGTILDDEAATAITAGVAPFTGSFRPEGLLSTLDGKPAAGTWTLEITDDAGGDIGSLTAWSVTIVSGGGAPTCVACSCGPALTMSRLSQAKSGPNLVESWPAVAGAFAYKVYRNTSNNPAGWGAATAALNTLTWIDANQLSNTTSQYYSVTDVSSCGNESPK